MMAYAGLGDQNEMFGWLEMHMKLGIFSLTFIKVERRWDECRADARFADLLPWVGCTQ
jgi:hypothetical protein